MENTASKPKVELKAENSIPEAKVHPRILGGRCEQDGLLYSACEHYKDVQVMCTYCGRSDKEMIKERGLCVYSLLKDPSTLIMVCSDFRCEQAHQKRFSLRVLI